MSAMRSESSFPTLRDFRDRLSELVDEGLGDLPAQILVLPDSTIQAIARHVGASGEANLRPALMIELDGGTSGRLPVSVISTDRMNGGGMPSRKAQ